MQWSNIIPFLAINLAKLLASSRVDVCISHNTPNIATVATFERRCGRSFRSGLTWLFASSVVDVCLSHHTNVPKKIGRFSQSRFKTSLVRLDGWCPNELELVIAHHAEQCGKQWHVADSARSNSALGVRGHPWDVPCHLLWHRTV